MIKNVKLDYLFKVEKDASVAPPRSQVVALDLDILFTRVYIHMYNIIYPIGLSSLIFLLY